MVDGKSEVLRRRTRSAVDLLAQGAPHRASSHSAHHVSSNDGKTRTVNVRTNRRCDVEWRGSDKYRRCGRTAVTLTLPPLHDKSDGRKAPAPIGWRTRPAEPCRRQDV